MHYLSENVYLDSVIIIFAKYYNIFYIMIIVNTRDYFLSYITLYIKNTI